MAFVTHNFLEDMALVMCVAALNGQEARP